MDLLSIIGLALTIIALLISLWQTKSAVTQTKELRSIEASMSTRYLGQFPDYMPTIVDLLSKAKREIIIVCDYPCYSYISDYQNWIRYSSMLQSKAADNNIKVSLVFTTPDRRRELLAEQFRYDANYPYKWKDREGVRQLVSDFSKRVRSTIPVENLTFDELVNLIEKENDAALHTGVLRSVTTNEIANPPTIYFWIADNEHAVFTIPSYTDFTREQGFATHDSRLIGSLRSVFDKLPARPVGKISEQSER